MTAKANPPKVFHRICDECGHKHLVAADLAPDALPQMQQGLWPAAGGQPVRNTRRTSAWKHSAGAHRIPDTIRASGLSAAAAR